MPEYYGYTPTKAIDWSSIGKGLSDTFSDIKVNREARAAKNEEIYQSAKKSVDSLETMKTQSLESFVGSSADEVRNNLLQANKDLKAGRIHPRDYRNLVNNINSSWGTFATTAKTLDERVMSAMQRQQTGEDGTPPPASTFEMFNMKQALSMKDLANKKVKVGGNGDLIMYDQNDPSNEINLRTIGNIEELVDNRVNVNKAVQSNVENWSEYIRQNVTGGGREKMIEDLTQSPYFKETEYDLINSIANPNNPRAIASILLDNSNNGYVLFKSEGEKNGIIVDAIRRKESIDKKEMSEDERKKFAEEYLNNKMIKVATDENGNSQPVVTDQMIKEAQDVVKGQIRLQLKNSMTESRGFAPQSNVGNGGGNNGSNNYATYASVLDAWDNGKMDVLNSMNPDYFFKWDPVKKQVHVSEIAYVPDGKGKGGTKKEYRYKSSAGNARELSRYFWKESTKVQAEQRFDDEKRAAIAAGVGPSNSTVVTGEGDKIF
jgi:hypothetical protein